MRGAHDEHRHEQCNRYSKCAHGEMVRVDGRDDHERDQVVDDDHGEDERAQPVREPRPDDREHAERERRVGRHRRAPAVRGRAARGEREIEGDRHRHPAETREERQRHPAALAQLADVELAPRLEADDEEEERHQAGVDPLAQVERDARAAEPDREGRVPEALVAREIDVRPEERGDARCEQERGAPGLRREELPHRRSEVACPGGVPGEGAGFGVLIRHRMILAAGAESGEAQCPAGSSTTTGMRRLVFCAYLS